MPDEELQLIVSTYKELNSVDKVSYKLNVSRKKVNLALFLSGLNDFKTSSLNVDEVRDYCSDNGVAAASKHFKINDYIFLYYCKMHNITGRSKPKTVVASLSSEEYINIITSVNSLRELVEKYPEFKNVNPVLIQSKNYYLGITYGKIKPLSDKEMEMYELYLSNPKLTYKQIGEIYNCSQKHINRVFTKIRNRFSFSRKGRNNPSAYSEEELFNELKKLYEKYGYMNKSIIENFASRVTSVYLTAFGSMTNIRNMLGIKVVRSEQDVFLDLFEYFTDISLDREVYLRNFDHSFDHRSMRFDGYNHEHKLAVEFDTYEHFHPLEIYGGKEGFEQRKIWYKIKDDFCKEHNIKLLRYPHFLPWTLENIKMKLLELNIKI